MARTGFCNPRRALTLCIRAVKLCTNRCARSGAPRSSPKLHAGQSQSITASRRAKTVGKHEVGLERQERLDRAEAIHVLQPLVAVSVAFALCRRAADCENARGFAQFDQQSVGDEIGRNNALVPAQGNQVVGSIGHREIAVVEGYARRGRGAWLSARQPANGCIRTWPGQGQRGREPKQQHREVCDSHAVHGSFSPLMR
jgi:hypothetical protein